MMGGGNNSPSSAANNPWAGGGMPPQPTPDQMNTAVNMLENPMIQQMMEQALSQNPDYFRNMLTASNPMLGQMFQNNPQAADDLIRSMMNPTVMRSMAQMQQAMVPPSSNNPISATAPQGQGIDFSSLLQSMQNPSTTLAPPGPPSTPADRYRNQLRSLYDMGFDDEQQSLAALQAAHGNLNRAVDMLLAGEVPVSPQAPAVAGDQQEPPPPSKDHEDKKND
jgi:ubiquilin